MVEFRAYLEQSNEKLTLRFLDVAAELAGLAEEIAMVHADERQEKVRGFHRSEEHTVSARERDADAQALNATITLFQLRGRAEALREEKEVLRFLLDAG